MQMARKNRKSTKNKDGIVSREDMKEIETLRAKFESDVQSFQDLKAKVTRIDCKISTATQ